MRPRRAAAVRGQAVRAPRDEQRQFDKLSGQRPRRTRLLRAPQGALQVTPGIPTRADGCRGAGVFPHAGRGIARNVGGDACQS